MRVGAPLTDPTDRWADTHKQRLGSFGSITNLVCAFTMLWLHALNRSKIAQCQREGITADKSEAFAELGDGSPLYRFVQHPFQG